jgi:DNA mismatch repair ATPase MutS
MKNSILYITSILLLSVTMLLGCQSRAKKVKNAEEVVQEEKTDLADSKRDLYEIRLDTISNYEQFKIEAEKLIIAQEKNIAEFKARLVSEKKEINADYNKKLVELEKKNKELKKKLADYKDDGQDKWNGFKKEFNHDINKLGNAFKDLTVENIN